ncbi:hypothetical protein AVEN_117060-1 [Araneus ventricosus]|uniref:Uncharacterized protein n=1 Tax=Araneus ventricosus TaxID=182803 RepID=A0A4Y2I0P7_ARAVE|nr:hypothetical protein AVEN_117060-1 [Araneus ventricosus]
MQLHKLLGGQFLNVLFHKVIDIFAFHLQSPDLGQRYNLAVYRLHRYFIKHLKVDNALRPKLLRHRSEVSPGDPFPTYFLYLEAENIFPKFSESKACTS